MARTKIISGTTTTDDGSWNLGETTTPRIKRLIKQRHGTLIKRAVWMNQVHGTAVKVVGAKERGLQHTPDGLITDRKGVALCMKSSDCVPVFVSGPGVVAIAHAGMPGVVQGILPQVIHLLRQHYGTNARTLTMRLGPHICRKCYAMSPNNLHFLKGYPDSQRFMRKRSGKLYFDMAAQLKDQAKRYGVKKIETDTKCTLHDEGYYSYRNGDGAKRMLSYIARL